MKVLFCLLLLAAVAHQGMTVDKCYICEGNQDSGCTDPFESSDSSIQTECGVSNATCFKYIVTTNGVPTWTRGCDPRDSDKFCDTMTETVEADGESEMLECETCETDLCNGSVQITASALSLFALAVLGRLLFA